MADLLGDGNLDILLWLSPHPVRCFLGIECSGASSTSRMGKIAGLTLKPNLGRLHGAFHS